MSARARLAMATAALALALAPVRPAGAQALGGATVDFVRVTGRGHHEVVASVIDPMGRPVAELERAFAVRLDGRDVARLAVASLRARRPRMDLALVVDGRLLSPASRPALQEAVRALGGAMERGDQLSLVVAGGSVRSRDGTAAAAAALAGALGAYADDQPPRVFDALVEAARRESRRSPADAGAIVLVTRGLDGGSTHTAIEALALARTGDRPTPVTVVFVGDEGTADVTDRLTRLAEHSAGAVARVTSADDLGSALPAVHERAARRWVLSFDAPGWDPRAPRHRLELGVSLGGESRTAALEYATAEVLARPWWASAWLWILPLLALAAAATGWLVTRPRQQFLLVHDGDEQDGIWYEVYRLPVRVGAAAGNDIVVGDPRVSRNHAVLEKRGRTVELVDLNSENGTLVNDERVGRRVLADGDRISLGPDVHLVYEAR